MVFVSEMEAGTLQSLALSPSHGAVYKIQTPVAATATQFVFESATRQLVSETRVRKSTKLFILI